MKAIRIVVGVILVLIVAIATTFVAAKYHDGPLGIFPGGPLVAGELVPYYIVGWEHYRDVKTIELQLAGDETSRTTWFLEYRGKGYIPASLGFPPRKTWHLRADGSEAVIRYRNERFSVRLERLKDPDIEAALIEIAAKKYGGGPPSDAGVWFFRTESLAPIPGIKL